MNDWTKIQWFFHDFFYKFQELFMKFNDFSMILKQIWISMIFQEVWEPCRCIGEDSVIFLLLLKQIRLHLGCTACANVICLTYARNWWGVIGPLIHGESKSQTMWVYFTLCQQSTLKSLNSGAPCIGGFGQTDDQRKFDNYIIGSRIGLVPIVQQAIIWTNDGFDHWCIYVSPGRNREIFKHILMINNISIFCNISLSKCRFNHPEC